MGLRARTDSSGAFRFASAPAGTVLLRVRRIGYQPYEDSVRVQRGGTTELQVRLSVRVQMLAGSATTTAKTDFAHAYAAGATSTASIGILREREPGTAEFVMSVNGGNQTVPTLLFPDGSAATNPSGAARRIAAAKAAAVG